MVNSESSTGRFQILSLDGGGIRGLYAAVILAAIEHDFDVRITDAFDLIAGTSTGGILAIGLGLGFRPREMVELYLRLVPQVFRDRLGLRKILRMFWRKYPPEPLARALRGSFGDRLFGESVKRLVIPSFSLDANSVYVFRTAHLDRLRRDFRERAWHVAMATAAAPTYFPVHRLPTGVRLIDGGVWANNPAMTALIEAVGVEHLSRPLSDVWLLSIGTLTSARGPRRGLDKAGAAGWAGSAADVFLDASSTCVTNQVQALLGSRFVRLNAQVADGEIQLDRPANADDLIGKAQVHSREYAPKVSRFLGHVAPVFVPSHSS